MQKINLDKNLRNLIEGKNLSQVSVSKKIGIRPSSLHGYMYGVIPKGVKNLVKISAHLNISLDELILGGKQ